MYASNPNFFRSQLGHYQVGEKIYQNKVEALLACEASQTPVWNFLDDTLNRSNWLKEPSADLYDLYRQRAWQLREQYDYLVLMFSGGIDSITVLRTFIDNDIPLDGIVTYGSYIFHDWDTMTRNAEAVKMALPLIQNLKDKKGDKINHKLLDDWHFYSRFQDESWVYATGNGQLSPEAYVFNFHWEDPFLQNFLCKGNTAIIRGVDKPRIIRENKEWKLVFVDAVTFGAFPSGVDTKTNHWYGTEYFFWQDRLPELLIKQAHSVRNGLIRAMITDGRPKNYWQDLLTLDGSRFNQKEYTKWVDPLVYGRYLTQLPGQDRNYFTLGKSPNALAWIRDHAFFEHGDSKSVTVWQKGIEYCVDNIHDRFFHDVGPGRNSRIAGFKQKGFRGLMSHKHTFAVDANDLPCD